LKGRTVGKRKNFHWDFLVRLPWIFAFSVAFLTGQWKAQKGLRLETIIAKSLF